MKKTLPYHYPAQHYIHQIRAHEWAEGQQVSMLEIDGLGKGRIRALWAIGIQTVDELMAVDVDDLLEKLRPRLDLPRDRDKARGIIEDWRTQISRLLRDREGRRPGPMGWDESVSAD